MTKDDTSTKFKTISCVSAPPELFEVAVTRAKQRGMTLSGYFRYLVLKEEEEVKQKQELHERALALAATQSPATN